MRWRAVLIMLSIWTLFGMAVAAEPIAPIRWMPPATFDPKAAGLGLPVLPGVQHAVIYSPEACRASVDEGGNGRYESLRHGTYNHHQQIAIVQDKFIVFWTNHARDENGPGQRLLGKVGTFNAERTEIDWGGDETMVELAGPPVPVRRRSPTFDPDVIAEAYVHGQVRIINGRIYVSGFLEACHGWTDDVKYHKRVSEPVPAEHWSDVKDTKRGFRWDMWRDLGLRFVQEWEVSGKTLRPASPLYKTRDLVERVEVTPGRFKRVLPPIGHYVDARPLSEAPARMRDDLRHGTPLRFSRNPKYAPGTEKLAADGKNGLAHHTEFRRPDGTWVAVRDNLINPTHYYAASKAHQDDTYPPAARTNLFGCAMPTAGELPDGSPWIICNNQSRHDMYLTLSRDGYVFDRTWLLLHCKRPKSDDGMFKGGGPQYFQSVTVGPNIWLVYSITKELIGVTRIPLSSLQADRPASVRSTLPVAVAEPQRDLLANGGFEGASGRLAPAWEENTWAAPGQDQRQHVSWAPETGSAHGGTTAQRITVERFVPGGGTALFQKFDFVGGRVYEGRIWLRATRSMKVKVLFRKRSFYYNTGAAAVLSVGPAWREVVIRGGYPTHMPGQFFIQLVEPGTLYADDARLKEVTADVLDESPASRDAVPRTFFGIHINKLGTHNTWPPLRFGTLRLWDTATHWAAVEPTKGAILDDDNWLKYPSPGFRLTYYLRHQQKHDPACQVIYTMGVTPVWAAQNAEPRFYTGTANPPGDVENWRLYVRTLGRRFSDRVRCWEIWNEADQGHQYAGDVKTIYEMTRIAHEELKAIRPDNLILSPNITIVGVAFLDEFLGMGGGRYVDVISWHHYPTLRPEDSLPAIEAVRDVLRRHKVLDKPLWNTEGKPGGDPGTPGAERNKDAVPDETACAAVARAHLVQWAYGIRVFCWYMFDEAADQVCIRLSKSSPGAAKRDYAATTRAGQTYNELARWLIGRRMVAKTVEQSTGGGQRWTIEIAGDRGYRGWIVWCTHGRTEMTIPADWDARSIRTLDGIPARPVSRFTAGPLPLLLDNRTHDST